MVLDWEKGTPPKTEQEKIIEKRTRKTVIKWMLFFFFITITIVWPFLLLITFPVCLIIIITILVDFKKVKKDFASHDIARSPSFSVFVANFTKKFLLAGIIFIILHLVWDFVGDGKIISFCTTACWSMDWTNGFDIFAFFFLRFLFLLIFIILGFITGTILYFLFKLFSGSNNN